MASGVESKIFSGIIISKPQKVGEEFIFSSNDPALGFTNYPSVVRVAAAGGSLVAVGAAKCKDALVAGSFGILCAGASETMNSHGAQRSQVRIGTWNAISAATKATHRKAACRIRNRDEPLTFPPPFE